MKVISLPEIASRIRCKRRSGRTFLAEFINQCKIEDAIIIPEGVTNGDMIKAMFNDFESALLLQVISKEWWNAPYKGGCNLSGKPTGSESEDKE
jgi:hypothetical protein